MEARAMGRLMTDPMTGNAIRSVWWLFGFLAVMVIAAMCAGCVTTVEQGPSCTPVELVVHNSYYEDGVDIWHDNVYLTTIERGDTFTHIVDPCGDDRLVATSGSVSVYRSVEISVGITEYRAIPPGTRSLGVVFNSPNVFPALRIKD